MGQTTSCGSLGNGVLNLRHTGIYNCNKSNMFQSILLLGFFKFLYKDKKVLHTFLSQIVFYANYTAGSCRTKIVLMSFTEGDGQWRLLCWG